VRKVRYICLNCGVIYESKAKVPQCPVCRHKKRMKFEDFEVLSELAKRENKPIFEVIHEAVECVKRRRNFWQKFMFW